MSSHPTFTSRFEIEDDTRIVTVTLAGDLDPAAVEDLHPQIQELVQAGYRQFVFDLSPLDHLGSVALRLLVGLARQLKGDGHVVLAGPSPSIATMIAMTRVDRLVKTYCTPDLAVAALQYLISRENRAGRSEI